MISTSWFTACLHAHCARPPAPCTLRLGFVCLCSPAPYIRLHLVVCVCSLTRIYACSHLRSPAHPRTHLRPPTLELSAAPTYARTLCRAHLRSSSLPCPPACLSAPSARPLRPRSVLTCPHLACLPVCAPRLPVLLCPTPIRPSPLCLPAYSQICLIGGLPTEQ